MSNKTTALAFDASQVAPQTPNEIIPPGWYIAEISDAEVKATKGRNAGKAANFEFTILSPEAKGRKVFANVNVQNASAQAQEIGQRELSSICHAIGIIAVSDLAPFIGRQLQVKIKTRKASDAEKEKGYEDRSEPGGYKALEGAPQASPGAGAPPAPPMPPGAPPAPSAPPAAPPAPVAAFPPEGWQANPNAPGWFWNATTGEQKQEADLRAVTAPPAAPGAPPAPTPPPAPAPAPPAPPAAPVAEAFPPAGWVAHPTAPGWFYNVANPTDMKDEAALRALAPVAPTAPPAAPGAPPAPPAPAAGSPPPWKQG